MAKEQVAQLKDEALEALFKAIKVAADESRDSNLAIEGSEILARNAKNLAKAVALISGSNYGAKVKSVKLKRG